MGFSDQQKAWPVPLTVFSTEDIIKSLCNITMKLDDGMLKKPTELFQKTHFYDKYMIVYIPEDKDTGHCAIIRKESDGKWYTDNELLKTDQDQPWKFWMAMYNKQTLLIDFVNNAAAMYNTAVLWKYIYNNITDKSLKVIASSTGCEVISVVIVSKLCQ